MSVCQISPIYWKILDVAVQSLNSMSDCDEGLSPTHNAIEEVARKRELRLLKNRFACLMFS